MSVSIFCSFRGTLLTTLLTALETPLQSLLSLLLLALALVGVLCACEELHYWLQ